MRLLKLGTTYLLALFIFGSCQDKNTSYNEADFAPLANDTLTADSHSMDQISRSGKFRMAARLPNIYTSNPLDTFSFPIIDENMILALSRQSRLIKKSKRRYNQKVGNFSINRTQLSETVDILKRWQHLIPIGIEKELEAHQLWGNDKKGNVKFTAYFSPVIPVSKRKTVIYKYPILSRPVGFSGRLPDRRNIELGALDTVVNPLAYATSKTDIYYMQLQGSGYIEYQDGTKELLSYAGENRHPYKSIETYLADNSKEFGISDISMEGVKRFLIKHPELVDSVLNQNPSYTFFIKSKSSTMGAGSVPLSADISIAVDPRYIPLGSCLLASVPILDKKGVVIGHEQKILFAQDVGGAIKGAGHVDIYFGAGEEAQNKANNFNAYGRMWLLLPKKKSMPLLYSANLNRNQSPKTTRY